MQNVVKITDVQYGDGDDYETDLESVNIEVVNNGYIAIFVYSDGSEEKSVFENKAELIAMLEGSI